MLFCILPNECYQPYSYTGSSQVVRYGPYSPREGVTSFVVMICAVDSFSVDMTTKGMRGW